MAKKWIVIKMSSSNYLKDNKELMKEYNYDKNKEIDLESLTLGSDKKIWWVCSKGHEWDAGIGSRYRSGAGCPICANLKVLKGYNDLESKCPNIVKEWNYKKNKLLPDEIVYVSSKKAWWKCEKGHEWETAIINRTKENGTNCPYCSNQKILPG
jgi:CRISPR/Cas system CMR-associated protein Cmr1 (group 7 of RAMP superfamily)